MSVETKALWKQVQKSGITVEQADKNYWAHKNYCRMSYDPNRVPRQCPECGRLIEIWSIADCLEKEKNEKSLLV